MNTCTASWKTLLLAAAVVGAAQKVDAATNFVAFGNFFFNPKSLTINVGDTVVWSNQSGSHSVTGTGSDPICGNPIGIANCTHTFNTAGTFPYICIPHEGIGMTGVVVVVTAANLAPRVALTMPTNSSVFTAGANITLQADASDSDGSVAKVEFFADTTLLGTATTTPYTFTWSAVPAGTYSLTAKATDNQGAVTTSSVASITVNPMNVPPTVTLASPTNNASFAAGADITLQADASDSDGTVAKVEFFEGTTSLGSATTAPYSFTWPALAAGTYTLTAKATDNLGATTTSGAVSITVSAANVPPTVAITSPTNNASFTAGANISLQADASDSDGTVANVEFFADTTLLGTATTTPYTFTWSAVPAGTYSLTAKATDNQGAVTTSSAASITVNPMNVPPTVTLASPTNNASFAAGADITLQADASDSDGTVAKVEFFEGTTSLGSATTAPYSFTWPAVAAGTYTLTAKATDNLGATTTSGAVSITVIAANVPPTVTITSPTNNATFAAAANISLQADASDSDGTVARVEFFAGTEFLGAATSTPYSVTWTNAAPGSYALTAKATDDSGATATSIVVNISVVSNTVSSVTLLDPSIKGTSFNFSFATQNGVSYTVQFKESLGSIDWQVLTNFSGNGTIQGLTDAAVAVQRFYRVSAQ